MLMYAARASCMVGVTEHQCGVTADPKRQVMVVNRRLHGWRGSSLPFSEMKSTAASKQVDMFNNTVAALIY